MSIEIQMESRLGFYLLLRSAKSSTEPANAARWIVIVRHLEVMVRAAQEKNGAQQNAIPRDHSDCRDHPYDPLAVPNVKCRNLSSQGAG